MTPIQTWAALIAALIAVGLPCLVLLARSPKPEIGDR